MEFLAHDGDNRVVRNSYLFVLLLLGVVGWFHLVAPLVAILLSYFSLRKLSFTRHRWLSVLVFLTLVAAVFYGFAFFVKQAIVELPTIISTTIPTVLDFANKHQIRLPFEDVDSLKALTLDTVREQLQALGNFARLATKEFVFVILGIAIGIMMFLRPELDLDRGNHAVEDNYYSLHCDAIAARLRSFYESFALVMGAQITISTINTCLTGMFVLTVGLPYPVVLIGVSFLCGLLPILGNLITNTIIVGIAFTLSPQLALAALVFLVVLHKMEYFLNSKIIGNRIRNPIWLTLIGLIVGEKLLGIGGMLLAPVILNYVKVEASRFRPAFKLPARD